MVVADGAAAPEPWASADRIRIDPESLADPSQLAELVDGLHRRWAGRIATVIELAVPDADLTATEVSENPPWQLGAEFSFPLERLVFVVWNNSYDGRQDPPRWWWDIKARRIDARPGHTGDVTLPDGREAWIDGGPRGPMALDGLVISYESVMIGSATPMTSQPDFPGDLAPDQQEAVAHGSGPARIIAPAGSGKTRVLTGRVRHIVSEGGIEPELVCAVAYNRRAAIEMQERLADVPGVQIRTLHSLGWEILRVARGSLTLIDERDIRRRIEPLVQTVKRPNTDTIGPYIEALSEVRIGLRSPAAVEAERDDIPDFARMFPRYRQRLTSNGEADHDEQIYGAIEALLADPDLRRHWQARCRHMLVDEFQDVTPAYLLMIRLLASPSLNVFGVGDDDQVIYGYAGADPSYLIEFDRLFPGAASHPLEVNYRCPEAVVTGAATLLSYNQRRIDKVIRAASGAATEDGSLEVSLGTGTALGRETAVLVDQWNQAGVKHADIAVLTRVNSSLLPVQAALSEMQVPMQGTLGPSLLERTVIRAALAWIRIALDPDNISRGDLSEAIRRPSRGLNRIASDVLGRRSRVSLDWLRDQSRTLESRRAGKWKGFCDDIEAAAGATGETGHLLDVLIHQVGLEGAAAALDAGRTRADKAAQTDDLRALRRSADLHSDPASFEPWLRAVLATTDQGDGVALSTIHRVKGLEWDRVIVFGVDRGAMPHALSDDIEEERRVFHVGITRGRHRVVVLADRKLPSRFLTELDGTAPVPQEAPVVTGAKAAPDNGVRVAIGNQIQLSGGFVGKVDEVLVTGVLVRLDAGAVMAVPWGERVDVNGKRGPLLPGDPGPDREMAQRLRGWRSEMAKRLAVPAYIVFNDATLDALASLRPTTEAGLLAVPGIGPTKLETYGDDLLAILAPF